MFRTPSDYVAEAPEVVYHGICSFLLSAGHCGAINGAYFFRDALDTRNACSIYKLPPFEVQLIVQLSAAVRSFHKAGQFSIMNMFVLFTSDTFPGFNVFFRVYYI